MKDRSMKTTKINVEKAVKFHGHFCPGLAFGIIASEIALDYFEAERAEDEEIVAVVENDSCMVDAIQSLTGCTFGKGNFIFKDYGKMAVSFYSRKRKKAIRIALKPGARALLGTKYKTERARGILGLGPSIFNVREIRYKELPMAERRPSIICYGCGEEVMGTRIKNYRKKKLCIPCYLKVVKPSKRKVNIKAR